MQCGHRGAQSRNVSNFALLEVVDILVKQLLFTATVIISVILMRI